MTLCNKNLVFTWQFSEVNCIIRNAFNTCFTTEILLKQLFASGSVIMVNIKQLLDEVEKDMRNYECRGLCYLPKEDLRQMTQTKA